MKYRMDNGTILDSDKAKAHWDERTYFDGHNHISVNTGSQWSHQKLYLSSKGRYYLVHWSEYAHVPNTAELLCPEDAARWLLHNECDLPADLEQYAADIEE